MTRQNFNEELGLVISKALQGLNIDGKTGKGLLQGRLVDFLGRAGFDADDEDTLQFLRGGLSVWRSKDTLNIEETRGRRRIDIVVRYKGSVVGLVETESDLNDLREHGVTRGSGHYDVVSIARAADGDWFHSYKSVERMAAGAFYAAGHSTEDLVRVQSNEPGVHNPLSIPMFVVTGVCRAKDRRILQPRLDSLGARLMAVIER